MRLRTYTAPTMPEAMQLVRHEMGDEAIIVSTHKETDGLSCRVIAAIEDDLQPTNDDQLPDAEADPGPTLEERQALIRQVLMAHGLPPHMLPGLIQACETHDVEEPALTLAAALDACINFKPCEVNAQQAPIVIVGAPGAGKTITVAKIAAQAILAGKQVFVATTDAKRAGGVEQLAAFTRILDIDLKCPKSIDDLLGNLDAIRTADFAIIDTAGVNPFNEDEMENLRAISDTVDGELMLVLAAGGDAMESADTARAFNDIGAARMIISRLDMTRRLVGILAAAIAGRMGIANVSINPKVAEGLSKINPVSMARLMMPESGIDETNEQKVSQ